MLDFRPKKELKGQGPNRACTSDWQLQTQVLFNRYATHAMLCAWPTTQRHLRSKRPRTVVREQSDRGKSAARSKFRHRREVPCAPEWIAARATAGAGARPPKHRTRIRYEPLLVPGPGHVGKVPREGRGSWHELGGVNSHYSRKPRPKPLWPAGVPQQSERPTITRMHAPTTGMFWKIAMWASLPLLAVLL